MKRWINSRDWEWGSRPVLASAVIRCMLPPLKIVRLKRNFGQTAALAAGLAYANGDIIVLMDGDGQNDPADIPALIGMLEEGNDLVAGWRYNRCDAFFSRRLPSMLANCLISSITSVKLHGPRSQLGHPSGDQQDRPAERRARAGESRY